MLLDSPQFFCEAAGNFRLLVPLAFVALDEGIQALPLCDVKDHRPGWVWSGETAQASPYLFSTLANLAQPFLELPSLLGQFPFLARQFGQLGRQFGFPLFTILLFLQPPLDEG